MRARVSPLKPVEVLSGIVTGGEIGFLVDLGCGLAGAFKPSLYVAATPKDPPRPNKSLNDRDATSSSSTAGFLCLKVLAVGATLGLGAWIGVCCNSNPASTSVGEAALEGPHEPLSMTVSDGGAYLWLLLSSSHTYHDDSDANDASEDGNAK